jgi:hypothetical protein
MHRVRTDTAHSSKNSNYLPDYTASHPTSVRTSISHRYMYRWTRRCSIANIICFLYCETHLKLSPTITNTLCIMKMLTLCGSSCQKTRHSLSVHIYLGKYTYAMVSRNVKLYFNLQFLTMKGLKMVSCISSINTVWSLYIEYHLSSNGTCTQCLCQESVKMSAFNNLVCKLQINITPTVW